MWAAPGYCPSSWPERCPMRGKAARDHFPGLNTPSPCGPPSPAAHHWLTFIDPASPRKLSSSFSPKELLSHQFMFLRNVSAKSSVKMRVFLSMSLGQPCLCTAFAQHCMDRTWLRRPTVALESGNDGLHFEPTTAGEGGYWVAGGVALAGVGASFRPLVCQQRDNVPPDGHHRLSPASKSAFFPRPTVIASPRRGTCPWPAHEAA